VLLCSFYESWSLSKNTSIRINIADKTIFAQRYSSTFQSEYLLLVTSVCVWVKISIKCEFIARVVDSSVNI